MWRPGFPFRRARVTRISTAITARSASSPMSIAARRSSPGLVLGLDRGGRCHGVAFRVARRGGRGDDPLPARARAGHRGLSGAPPAGAARRRPAGSRRWPMWSTASTRNMPGRLPSTRCCGSCGRARACPGATRTTCAHPRASLGMGVVDPTAAQDRAVRSIRTAWLSSSRRSSTIARRSCVASSASRWTCISVAPRPGPCHPARPGLLGSARSRPWRRRSRGPVPSRPA